MQECRNETEIYNQTTESGFKLRIMNSLIDSGKVGEGWMRGWWYAWPGLAVNSADGKMSYNTTPIQNNVSNVFKHSLSLRACSPIWASEASLEKRPLAAWPLARAFSPETRFTSPNRRACSQAISSTGPSPVLENVRHVFYPDLTDCPLGLRGWEQCGVYSRIMNEKLCRL